MSGDVVSPVFIGRREEMAVLSGALEQAAAGDPGFVLLGGEAGVGKTRLLGELTARAQDAGMRVLAGQCVEPGAEGLPLAPLMDVLRTLVRTMPPDCRISRQAPGVGGGLSLGIPHPQAAAHGASAHEKRASVVCPADPPGAFGCHEHRIATFAGMHKVVEYLAVLCGEPARRGS